MELDQVVKNLHPLEVKVLLHFTPGEDITPTRLIDELGYKLGQCNQTFSWLSGKNFIEEKSRETVVVYELTEYGSDSQKNGTPGERLVNLLKEKGSFPMAEMGEALGLERKDIGSAFGQMSKAGILSMDAEKNVSIANEEAAFAETLERSLLNRSVDAGFLNESDLTDAEKKTMSGISKKRGAAGAFFRYIEKDEIIYSLTADGDNVKAALLAKGVTGEEIGALTPALLASGKWKDQPFRSYNVNIPPSRVLLGRKNPYGEYLQLVKDKLVSLGFEEFDGPLVETEFWNGDALFMPQFHAARDIHDVYYVKNPMHAKEIEQPWMDNVAAVHKDGGETGSRGWGYAFDRDFTRRLVLRSQGTVLSAKQLHKAKIPGKYFGVARCFRYDQVDATHGADFYQTEGIVLGNDVNLRTLLGLLKMFAEELAGATEVKYVPAYFPFTEPSIEVHIKHPVLGWFELGGAGIFRPEVTKSQGIDVPVLAWGLGIDRMALMHLGINDLRDLFSSDIENVRLRRRS